MKHACTLAMGPVGTDLSGTAQAGIGIPISLSTRSSRRMGFFIVRSAGVFIRPSSCTDRRSFIGAMVPGLTVSANSIIRTVMDLNPTADFMEAAFIVRPKDTAEHAVNEKSQTGRSESGHRYGNT